MHRKRLLCWKAYLPRSSWPTQPTTPIICARPSLPKARSPSSPTPRHGRSNIRSTSISMPSAISWSAASQNSNNSAASQPASKRQPEITLPSSLSQPSSYGCDKCPHHLAVMALINAPAQAAIYPWTAGQNAVIEGTIDQPVDVSVVLLSSSVFGTLSPNYTNFIEWHLISEDANGIIFDSQGAYGYSIFSSTG